MVCYIQKYRINSCKGRTFFFHSFDEVRPLHGTAPFGQNSGGAASNLCTPRILRTPRLSPSSSGTRKYAEGENSPMSVGAAVEHRTQLILHWKFFFQILGCQFGGAAIARVQPLHVYTVCCMQIRFNRHVMCLWKIYYIYPSKKWALFFLISENILWV